MSNPGNNQNNSFSIPINSKFIVNAANNNNVFTGNSSPINNTLIPLSSSLQKNTTIIQQNNHIKLLNQNLPTALISTQNVTTPITLVPTNQINTSVASPNSNINNVSSSYGGFAHCSNCGSHGVKAAFYGKSKLYCSVACQNGIKKQQQQNQQSQGTKRTIESLNYSSCSSANNSPVAQNTTSVIVNTSTTANAQNIITNPMNSPTPILTANLKNPIIPTIEINNQTSREITRINSIVLDINNQPINTESNNIAQINNIPVITTTQGVIITNIVQENQKPQVIMNLKSDYLINTHTLSNSLTSQNGHTPKRARNTSSSSNSPQKSTNIITSSEKQLTLGVNEMRPMIQNNETNDSKLNVLLPLSAEKSKFQWSIYITEKSLEAAPVTFFKHAPMSRFWKKMMSNIIVEVPNFDLPYKKDSPKTYETSESKDDPYWFATIIQYAGYLVKLRYVGYEDESKNDFWMHMCDSTLHPVGWSTKHDISLIPPETLIEQYENWKSYLEKILISKKTLPTDFHIKIKEALESKFKKGMLLELVDKKKFSQMRVARITENIGCRLRLKYENYDETEDFWVHEKSELIHPIGWSAKVGHPIYASEEYKKKSLIKYEKNNYESNECTPNMFQKANEISSNSQNLKPFKPGMKLESVDPLSLSLISVATIGKILKENYLMIRIDGYELGPDDDSDMFCCHRASSTIFPAGFCQKNSLQLQFPYGYKGKFNWKTYLNQTNTEFSPNELFNMDTSLQNPFKVGMKLESVDLMEPKLVCVATVIAVVDRLIRLAFDGWEKEYDQWVDHESCGIYPVGWCQLVNYELQPPLENGVEKKKKKPKKSRK